MHVLIIIFFDNILYGIMTKFPTSLLMQRSKMPSKLCQCTAMPMLMSVISGNIILLVCKSLSGTFALKNGNLQEPQLYNEFLASAMPDTLFLKMISDWGVFSSILSILVLVELNVSTGCILKALRILLTTSTERVCLLHMGSSCASCLALTFEHSASLHHIEATVSLALTKTQKWQHWPSQSALEAALCRCFTPPFLLTVTIPIFPLPLLPSFTR